MARASVFSSVALALTVLVAVPAVAATPTFALNGGLPNLQTLKDQIITYYTSGRYTADTSRVDARLAAYADARLHDGAKRPAVVFDIDDTAISSFAYERAHDFAYDVPSWNAWEHADRFPAIPATLRLARHLAAEHIAIFFVTGRRQPDRATTLHELAAAGYPTPAGLYLRPVSDHARSVIPFKSQARAEIAAQGYDILASVGDQWSDLRGGHAERLYKLPNPMYFLP